MPRSTNPKSNKKSYSPTGSKGSKGSKKSYKGPMRAKVIKVSPRPIIVPCPRFCSKLLKVLFYNIHRSVFEKPIDNEIKEHEIKNVEYCGFLKKNIVKYDTEYDTKEHTELCVDGKVTKGYNEFENGKFKGGKCKRPESKNLRRWHTHFKGTPIYPSGFDILNTCKEIGITEFIFTDFGFWILKNINIPQDYYQNWRTTLKTVSDMFYLNHLYLEIAQKDIEGINLYINIVTNYIDGLEMRFITWNEYFITHLDQAYLYLFDIEFVREKEGKYNKKYAHQYLKNKI